MRVLRLAVLVLATVDEDFLQPKAAELANANPKEGEVAPRRRLAEVTVPEYLRPIFFSASVVAALPKGLPFPRLFRSIEAFLLYSKLEENDVKEWVDGGVTEWIKLFSDFVNRKKGDGMDFVTSATDWLQGTHAVKEAVLLLVCVFAGKSGYVPKWKGDDATTQYERFLVHLLLDFVAPLLLQDILGLGMISPIIIYGSMTFPWAEGNRIPLFLVDKLRAVTPENWPVDKKILGLALAICAILEYIFGAKEEYEIVYEDEEYGDSDQYRDDRD